VGRPRLRRRDNAQSKGRTHGRDLDPTSATPDEDHRPLLAEEEVQSAWEPGLKSSSMTRLTVNSCGTRKARTRSATSTTRWARGAGHGGMFLGAWLLGLLFLRPGFGMAVGRRALGAAQWARSRRRGRDKEFQGPGPRTSVKPGTLRLSSSLWRRWDAGKGSRGAKPVRRKPSPQVVAVGRRPRKEAAKRSFTGTPVTR